MKPRKTIHDRNTRKCPCDRSRQLIRRTNLLMPQNRLHLCPKSFNRIQVGAVWRQKQKLHPGSRQNGLYCFGMVRTHIVHDENILLFVKSRQKMVLKIFDELFGRRSAAVGRVYTFPARSDRRQNRRVFRSSQRYIIVYSRTAFRTSVPTGQIDVDSALIQKYQMTCVVFRQKSVPFRSLFLYIGDAPVRWRAVISSCTRIPASGLLSGRFLHRPADSVFL